MKELICTSYNGTITALLSYWYWQSYFLKKYINGIGWLPCLFFNSSIDINHYFQTQKYKTRIRDKNTEKNYFNRTKIKDIYHKKSFIRGGGNATIS